MSIFHCSIRIISRTGGRSAIASAAYRAGEKLYNDETGLTHNFTRKGGVVMNEILLPKNAPARFQNREILWNEVQKIEKRSDAQFAREIEVAFPTELNREQQIECARNYILENFVDKGMIADWALHDKGDGNPHAHIMLTMRGLDEHEEWLKKQKNVFANARDVQGRPVYDPTLPVYDPKDKEHTSQYRIPALDKDGRQKTRVRKGKGTEYLWEKISIPANDWNDHSMAEIWRSSWADHCNRYLAAEQQIDHRSYKRQGIDLEPTIHEGVIAIKMEQDGRNADRCRINRDVKERNSIRIQLKELAEELTKLITEKARAIYGRFKEFGRRTADADCHGGDADDSGKPAGRDRETEDGKPQHDRRTGRIHELKRTADESDQEIERTDQEIAGTDCRIEELRQLAAERKAAREERFNRIKRRRASYHDGGNPGGKRENTGREYGTAGRKQVPANSGLRSTANDISAFLRELDTKERASEEMRNDRISERADRETLRERSRFETERTVGTAESGIKGKRTKGKARGRSHGFDR